MIMETAMNSQQQILPQQQDLTPPSDSIATMFVKGGDDSTSAKQTINLLNSLPSSVDAEYSADKPGLTTVHFDPRQTRGSDIVNSLHKAGRQHACIALIYFKDGNDSDYKHDVAQSVISQFGVIATERSAHKAYVLIVHFDQHLTRSSQIVKSLQKQGFPAMLVGC